MMKISTSLLDLQLDEPWASSPMSTTSTTPRSIATLADLAPPFGEEHMIILKLARRRRLTLTTPRAPMLRPSYVKPDALAEMEPLMLEPAYLATASLKTPPAPALRPRPTLDETLEEMEHLSLPISLSDSEASLTEAEDTLTFEEEHTIILTTSQEEHNKLLPSILSLDLSLPTSLPIILTTLTFEEEHNIILTLARRRRASLITPRAPALRPRPGTHVLEEMELLTLEPACLAIPLEPACLALRRVSAPRLRPTLDVTPGEMDALSLPMSLSDSSESDFSDSECESISEAEEELAVRL
jgi:hypothetical protein